MARKDAFTQHVRDLVRGDVTREELEAPWGKLRDALLAAMRQRALFNASPSCLGIYGFPSWTEEGIDELAADCYTSVFLRRLPSLAAQLERKANVEGLIFNNVRHYLHEIQRKHDPLGFRVYTVLRAAVCAAVDHGMLRIDHGDPAVRNETVLAVAKLPGAATLPEGRAAPDLESMVRKWSEELLPDLVTARGKALDPVVDHLTECLKRLADHGPDSFRFRDVAKLLKYQVRSQWGALWAHDSAVSEGDQEFEALARAVRPPAAVEERDAFEKLVACVSDALETVPASPRTRSYLHRLWIFLRNHSAEDGDALPSRRRLSELLDIPRARFSELYATLGRTVQMSREILSSPQAPRQPALRERKRVGGA